jgi:hypothetical protein
MLMLNVRLLTVRKQETIGCQVGNVEPVSLGVVTGQTLGHGFLCTAFWEEKKATTATRLRSSTTLFCTLKVLYSPRETVNAL